MQHFSGQKKLICPPGEHRAGREIYRMENSVSSAALNAAREQLDAAEAAREVILLQHIANGVVIDSRTVQIAPDVVIAPGAVILAGTILRGRTVIGAGCIIGPNTLIEDSIVDEGSTVNASQVYSSHIGPHNNIGPFTHVRVNTVTDYGVHLGAYVETKNSNFARGNTVSHLTYIGDSDVGKYCNFGCGTVTCNYDGKDKFRTQIGDYCFIGCNTNLVAVHLALSPQALKFGLANRDVPLVGQRVQRGKTGVVAGAIVLCFGIAQPCNEPDIVFIHDMIIPFPDNSVIQHLSITYARAKRYTL